MPPYVRTARGTIEYQPENLAYPQPIKPAGRVYTNADLEPYGNGPAPQMEAPEEDVDEQVRKRILKEAIENNWSKTKTENAMQYYGVAPKTEHKYQSSEAKLMQDYKSAVEMGDNETATVLKGAIDKINTAKAEKPLFTAKEATEKYYSLLKELQKPLAKDKDMFDKKLEIKQRLGKDATDAEIQIELGREINERNEPVRAQIADLIRYLPEPMRKRAEMMFQKPESAKTLEGAGLVAPAESPGGTRLATAQPAQPQPAQEPQSDQSELIKQAINAVVMKNKDPEAVKKKLIELGVPENQIPDLAKMRRNRA